ncbi:hypothetical protein M885DRAFT_548363 [Pelagophyceae sp. CCMP2097]|nr:hypothetical protein M885DRAFT_548363 [Pelagophyceae sp. CCMP2097]|mmetsp:Transcript_22513/g.80331  ORF Transcript_22513/g.80331 Transcript_22513/m.80331 type:complete len:350 (-) Transcript_22513:56-1105(-)
MVVQLDERVRRRWCGLGSKIQTAPLPDGGTTLAFQNWRVAFGKAKKPKKTKSLQGVTKEAIAADRTGAYVHSLLLAAYAPQNIFGPEYYCLEYRLPEAPFTIRVFIDDVAQCLRAYDQFSTLPTKVQQRLVLRVVPRALDGDAPLFDLRPPKTIHTQLKTRAAMTRYLVDLYAKDEVPLAKVEACMQMKMNDLRAHILDLVPAHEKTDHSYLDVAYRASRHRRKTPEQKYIDDDIDLQTYGDLKEPDRRLRRLQNEATYPLPEQLFDCVVCRRPNSASIKCMECHNRCCKGCVQSKFLDCVEDRAFVLLHHIYCLKLGEPIRRPPKQGQAKTPPKQGQAKTPAKGEARV